MLFRKRRKKKRDERGGSKKRRVKSKKERSRVERQSPWSTGVQVPFLGWS